MRTTADILADLPESDAQILRGHLVELDRGRKRIAELESVLSQLRAEFTIRTDALVEGRAKVTEQMAEIAQLETILAEQEHRPFRFAICDVLGECTSCLPAGETWAATDGGVIQYIKDIVAALAYTTDSRDVWMRVTGSRQEQIVELEVALGCAGKKIHEDEGTILQLQEGVIRSTQMIADLQVALAEARTHYGFGSGRRYRIEDCDHPWHRNPGLITECPQCAFVQVVKGAGDG